MRADFKVDVSFAVNIAVIEWVGGWGGGSHPGIMTLTLTR